MLAVEEEERSTQLVVVALVVVVVQVMAVLAHQEIIKTAEAQLPIQVQAAADRLDLLLVVLVVLAVLVLSLFVI